MSKGDPTRLLTVNRHYQDQMIEALLINSDLTDAEAREAVEAITRVIKPPIPIEVRPETLAACARLLSNRIAMAQCPGLSSTP